MPILWAQAAAALHLFWFITQFSFTHQRLLFIIPKIRLPSKRICPFLKVLINQEINLFLSFFLLFISFFQLFDFLMQFLQMLLSFEVNFSLTYQLLIEFILFLSFYFFEFHQLFLLLQPLKPIATEVLTHDNLFHLMPILCSF